ncbi:MAG: twin-arginine translocation signal domain-containing protein [Candidatus Rokubacteria bacterium]|nr:twin-arginine translocation signal domain-containing protein [Candidatus Rokubacteria bacterium]
MDRRSFLKLGAVAALGLGATPVAPDPRERRLANLRQLTAGGQNAEAYFDTTGTRLIFQSTRPPYGCDQIFTMKDDGTDVRLVSTGKGRTTCGFFFPDGKRILYATTHFGGEACPPPPERTGGYVWPIYPSYEIVSADADGGNVTRLTNHDGYDAEGAVSSDGRHIVFTSLREGDLDLYVMDADGKNVRRLTDGPGYDGGPFFSWDGRFVVFRASRPEGAALDDYRALLRRGLVRPGVLEIYLVRADGTGLTQVTRKGAASFAPFLHPNNQQIVFSSNIHDPSGRTFALYLVNVDGSGLERLTFADSFASFPMFSRDGKRLVFTANRHASAPREQNVFIADWVA